MRMIDSTKGRGGPEPIVFPHRNVYAPNSWTESGGITDHSQEISSTTKPHPLISNEGMSRAWTWPLLSTFFAVYVL